MKHLLSLQQLTGAEIADLVNLGAEMKASRGRHATQPLAGQTWAMIFQKSSTRTRVSFDVGIRELGGGSMFLSGAETQLGRGEPIQDTARVLGRMVHGAVIRTFAQADIELFAELSGIPTINALTDEEHPCQILADLLTMQEKLGGWEGKTVAFLGDGDCNVARSWIWAASRLGFTLRIGAPHGFQPSGEYLANAGGDICATDDAKAAADGADAVYTDVWVSMGKEAEAADRIAALAEYQVNADLLAAANPGAIVMHCLPAYRGKEIDEATLEAHADTIFQQAENRVHAQKAVLAAVAAG